MALDIRPRLLYAVKYRVSKWTADEAVAKLLVSYSKYYIMRHCMLHAPVNYIVHHSETVATRKSRDIKSSISGAL